MTLTLELPDDLAAQLQQAATKAGMSLEVAALDALRAGVAFLACDAAPLSAQDAQKRREAAVAGLGMFAGRGLTVDEFLTARHAEAQAEAERNSSLTSISG